MISQKEINDELLKAWGIKRKKESKPRRQLVLFAGGLPACGKSSHLKELDEQLTTLYNLKTEYIDKDLIGIEIGKQTGVEPDSLVIYSEMLKRARNSLGVNNKDIVFLEGNIIGNLGLFTSFIVEQHLNDAIIICLDFLCSDENKRYIRMAQRSKVDNMAAERDRGKINNLEYFQEHSEQQKRLHDFQLNKHKELFEKGMLKLLSIDTSICKNISANVKTILKFIQKYEAKTESSHFLNHAQIFAKNRGSLRACKLLTSLI